MRITQYEIVFAAVVVALVGLIVWVILEASHATGPSKHRLSLPECADWCAPVGGVEEWQRSVSRQVNPGAKVPAYVSESYCECVLPASAE